MAIDPVNPAALKDMHFALIGMLSGYRELLTVGAKHGMDLSQYMSGTIIWNKALGKPSGPKPSDGFVVRLHTVTDRLDGGAMDTPLQHDDHLQVDSYPVKWDDSDADHYVVHFLQSIPSATQYALHVTIADGVTWVDEANKPVLEGHFMSPSLRTYGKDTSTGKTIPMPSWIEPFYVVGSTMLKVTQPA